MRKLHYITLFLALLTVATVRTSVGHTQEYEPWTGAVTGANIHFGNDETLKSIRRMINEGKTEDAVRESQKFLSRLINNSRSGRTSSYEYDAYNALCISLTSNKQYKDAIEACNTAIEMAPGRWQALNSRGSAHYKNGQYAEALNDYNNALVRAPSADRIRKIIEHNIEISQERVSGN